VTAAQDAVSSTNAAHRGLRGQLAAAAGILTRFPVNSPTDSAGAAAFGLIGAMIGAAGSLVLVVVVVVAPAARPVAAVLALAVMVVLSGALHFDGLSDTADALVAPTAEAAERARRDPRSGPAGIVALVLVLLADWSLIVALLERADVLAAAAALTAAGAVSRAVAAVGTTIRRTGFRPGFGSWFADRVAMRDGAISLITATAAIALLALATAWPGLVLAGCAGALAGVAWLLALQRLRRGLDGDALGAVIELTLTSTLLAAVLLA
jgi:adenosylcobinamide-GDP ribazoletransferase